MSIAENRGLWNGKFDEIVGKAILNFADMMHDMGISPHGESQIEQMLGLVFFANECMPSYNGNWFEYQTNYGVFQTPMSFDDVRETEFRKNTVYVFPQVSIAQYRADFICGMKIKPIGRPFKMQFLCIECDGHDFHEKTKEQAARDKLRDRTLLLHGIPCMRFTGSEIWRDAYACAHHVDEFFRKSVAEYAGIEYEPEDETRK